MTHFRKWRDDALRLVRPYVPVAAFTQLHNDLLLHEAEVICKGRTAIEPDESRALHIRGLVASRSRNDMIALACFRRAAALAPSAVMHQIDLGSALARQGHYAEAETAYRRALSLTPDNLLLLRRLGHVLLRQQQTAEALSFFEHALHLHPDAACVHSDLAQLKERQGHLTEALTHQKRAIEQGCRDAPDYYRLGRLLMRLEHFTIAADAFRSGLSMHPERAILHAGLGEALLRLHMVAEAVTALRAALSRDPFHLKAGRYLVCALEYSGDASTSAAAWCAFGEALQRADRPEESALAYRQAVLRKPDCLRAHFGLGAAHIQLGRPHKAIQHLQSALAIQPTHAGVRQDLGWVYHLEGDTKRGWEEFNYYDRHFRIGLPTFEQPVWEGAASESHTVLLWADEALGDTIQFVRFAPIVKNTGAQVLVECSDRLAALIERMASVDRVVPRGMPHPPFDRQISLSGLARLGEQCGDSVRISVPYLSADKALIADWHERLASPKHEAWNVGLVWGGDPTRKNAGTRFTSLTSFAPLASIEGVRYVSLQQGMPALELVAPPRGLRVDTFEEETLSLLQTAALIMNLDLVITVDTMLAHLAGALGRPVWTLLPFAPDWRWRRHGDDSRWYPTMRLFRQRRAGDWDDLLNSVREALEDAVLQSPQASVLRP